MAKTIKMPRDNLIPKITLKLFKKPKAILFLWIFLSIFGLFSYTTLLKREGFPSINLPVAFINGAYFVNNPAQVDEQIAKPIADLALKQDGADKVQTVSGDNFFNVYVQYDENVDVEAKIEDLKKSVSEQANLPEAVQVQYNVPKFGVTGGENEKIDLTIAFYNDNDPITTNKLVDKGRLVAEQLNAKNIPGVERVFVKDPFETVTNPSNNQPVIIQKSFGYFGIREDNQTSFYDSVTIAVTGVQNVDVLKLDQSIRSTLEEIKDDPAFAGYDLEVSASFAPAIEDNISELQKALLEGLIAVLVVGSVVIATRAALITIVSMITVLLSTLAFLYVIGYSLNVITLFSLILGLALIVDDTIIMVEAVDAARLKQKKAIDVIRQATKKVSRAMVAATTTAALSFMPIAFVGGILGEFIRAIPITIIASLFISLLVALVFIPLFSRYILLGKNQMGSGILNKEIAAGVEKRIAKMIARPMLWARHSRKKIISVGLSAILVSFGFIIGGIYIARSVEFNIFPSTKDANGLMVNLNFPPDTTIEKAQEISAQANEIIARELGDNFVRATYYSSGSEQSAVIGIDIIPYSKRDIKSPQLVEQLQASFDKSLTQAQASVSQTGVGPPPTLFSVQIKADKRVPALALAKDIAKFLDGRELKRVDGSLARVTDVIVSNPNQYMRSDGQTFISVTADFDATDTTTLVNLAQTAIKDNFDSNRVESYGLSADAIYFDLGQETENQDSFNTLVLAFPLMLLVIYVVLAIEFKSFLQPLLIFMAIPFSIFGVMFGLFITDNAISFFSMLGFFALVGLSIKNTILLTDYANQARASGFGAVDAAVEALEERFRPLIATSLTAVVSLIPLAIMSPFWEGLTAVLIFGLLSSTFLVITVFPYYYLAGEYLRSINPFRRNKFK